MNMEKEREEQADRLGEECGVFGIYDFDGHDVASTIYYGLFALQHRGQESCGIAVSDTNGPKGKVLSVKEMGLLDRYTGDARQTERRYRGGACALFHGWEQYEGECAASGAELCEGNAGACA